MAALVSVCVVIPTRNRPDSLRRAVVSVLSQEGASLEVVVVDEASVPPADQALASTDHRVRIIRNDVPRGPAAARNQGAAVSTSSVVAFLDDDDTWRGGKLAACLECLHRHPEAGMIYHLMGGKEGRADGACRPLVDQIRAMLVRQPPHLDSVVIRRSVHEAVRFDETFPAAADLDYLLRVAETTSVIELAQVLADHGTDDESEIGIRKRIAGRLRFSDKHGRYFSDPQVAAFHYARLGHLYRRDGQRLEAAKSFGRALRQRPGLALAWRGLVMLLRPHL